MKLKLSKNAEMVLQNRTLRRSASGKVLETPEEMMDRVATIVSGADANYGATEDEVRKFKEQLLEVMSNLEFLPSSPVLMNAGTELAQLSSCHMLPLEDSMDSIFSTMRECALVNKAGAGVGISFSNLRESGSIITTTGRGSSGPLSFMRLYNESMNTVNEAAKRTGAMMGVLRVDHPDILDFIISKQDGTSLTNFNISVGITDAFMKALEDNEAYDLVSPKDGKPVRSIKAADVWDLICEMAWKSADPGLVFLDEINRHNTLAKIAKIEGVNVCGEQPLLPYESCLLGSIAMKKMLTPGPDGAMVVDYNKLRRMVQIGVHALDNIIDVNVALIEKMNHVAKARRKIGLAVMGFADMLYMMGVPYNSEKALKLAEEIMKFVYEEAEKASIVLAEKRGSFASFDKSTWPEKGIKKIRNANLTTIAPNGNLSVIADCSSGVEPVFALVNRRNTVLSDKAMIQINPVFEEEIKARGLYSEELINKIAKDGSIQNLEEIPDDIKKIFVISHEVEPVWHVRMQAAFQKYVDSAVSKTVNMPEDATKEEVKRVYKMAYDLKCKGVTVYRDKSKDVQVMRTGAGEESDFTKNGKGGGVKTEIKLVERPITPRKRPRVVEGKTYKISTGCGGLYITIGEDEKGINEVIARIGKPGGCASAQSEILGRLISLALRGGIDAKVLIKELRGIRCDKPCLTKDGTVLSCADALGRTIGKHLAEKNKLI